MNFVSGNIYQYLVPDGVPHIGIGYGSGLIIRGHLHRSFDISTNGWKVIS